MRAFPDIHRSVFRTEGHAHFYDLPIKGVLETPAFLTTASSRLAEDGTITLRIGRAAPGQSLTVRQPGWCAGLSVQRNGSPISGVSVSNLKSGDLLCIRYAMHLREESTGETGQLMQRRAFSFGPWLLGACSRANPKYFGEMHPDNRLLPNTVQKPQNQDHSRFRVPIAASTFSYLAADFPDQPALVELRAIAEQTATMPSQWEMAFLTQTEPGAEITGIYKRKTGRDD